jgi:hypothetical protein
MREDDHTVYYGFQPGEGYIGKGAMEYYCQAIREFRPACELTLEDLVSCPASNDRNLI